MIIEEQEYLAHYGTPRHSGRYPWGSGGDPVATRSKDLLGQIESLKQQGLNNTEIARALGMTTTEFVAQKSIAKHAKKAADIAMAERLKAKGMANTKIGERMGINESSVRALLAPGQKEKNDVLIATSSLLRDAVAEHKYVDIGKGTENHLGVTRDKLRVAVQVLKDEGHKVYYVKVPTGPGKFTNLKILAAPDADFPTVAKNPVLVHTLASRSEDGGKTFFTPLAPLSIDSKRVGIRYKEDGGDKEDGVIYVRPGVDDVSIGKSRYAQVRIAVDGTHYLKGMAIYKDDLPPGVDLVFNTNKSSTGNKLDAMKPMKRDLDGNIDPNNPFGSQIRSQLRRKDKDGKDVVTSSMNIVYEEGSWDDWSRTIASQVLSKQSHTLAKQQLDVYYDQKKQQYEDIMALTNPTVKRKLLEEFSDNVDSAASHLVAAKLPRQSTHVIIPLPSLKDTEVYAPNFLNGERVVLIRYPHGGTFEIPELTVNNRNPQGKKILGQAKDAVGINHKVAEKLSGADFDGDTVLVIPNNSGRIKTSPSLDGLKDFDPKAAYPSYPGMPKMSARQKGLEMGNVSNLITDMTIKGAREDEIAKAVRHSMVVIDAEKHNLNYKQSAIDNEISSLKKKYQGSSRAGAATLISRATAPEAVIKRKPRTVAKGGPIDLVTGQKRYEIADDATYIDYKTGKTKTRKEQSTKLKETDDAFTLSSGTPIEKVYAVHANKMKALANEARLSMVRTKTIPVSNSAKKVYKQEVESLNAKLNIALKNAPLERKARVVANSIVEQKRAAYPNMTDDDLKKVKHQALHEARNRIGANKQQIFITDKEWDAIQSGAISNHKLTQILDNANSERVKQLATPITSTLMNSAKKARAQSMLAIGYTQAEIADALGVSLSTLKDSIG